MSRSLRPVFFVLFLASAIAASAGPDDLFDARTPGALQPGQQEILLALESGRYTLKDGNVLDARASDPARARLTNARVAELLSARGTGLPPLPHAAIASGALVPRALPLAAKGTPANLNFDGVVARAGDIRGPPASGSIASGSGAPPAAGVLHAQFLTRLVFKGNRQEREALSEAVATILKTKTGRELAAQFVNERAAAEVTLETIDNSTAVQEKGRKILSGTSGQTDVVKDPPKITLNRAYLDTDPEYRRVVMAGTLAHELFGHALEAQRAKKAGVPRAVLFHYRGDEIGSRLIDWMVQTELSGKVEDGEPKEYLGDPEGYYRGLLTVDPYYIVTLSPAEMKNPLTTLRGRRKLLKADAARTTADIKDMESWRPIIAHFVSVHRMPKARFAPAEEELNVFLTWAYGHQKKLSDINESLEGVIAHWSSPAGAKEKRQVIEASGSAYMNRMEAAAAARARELRRLRADPHHGRNPASTEVLVMPGLVITASGAPVIDLDELSRMNTEDRQKHPGHWK
jgi:hypothetical protein